MKSEIEFIAGIQSWGSVVFKEKKGGGWAGLNLNSLGMYDGTWRFPPPQIPLQEGLVPSAVWSADGLQLSSPSGVASAGIPTNSE